MALRKLDILTALCLAIGGIFGIAGTFAPTDALRGLAWGIDGVSLVVADTLLFVRFFRAGEDLVGAGFLVLAVGQGLIVSSAAASLAESVPSFGAGVGLWAAGLTMVSLPKVFPIAVRVLGVAAAVLFAITALRIFGGSMILPITAPLPFFAYPVFVATMAGWIWTILRTDRGAAPTP